MERAPFAPALDCEGADATDLPDADAMIAGAVALMTAWADPCPHARLPRAELRRLLARKLVSQLFFLQQHPKLSAGLRQSLSQAQAHWRDLAQGSQPEPTAEPDTVPERPRARSALH